jgi:hypothetical protein
MYEFAELLKVSPKNQTKCATWSIAQGYVTILNGIIRKIGTQYSGKLAALQTEKYKFEGSKSTTRIARWHQRAWWRCSPQRKSSRDKNPQLKKHGGIAGPREIFRGIRIRSSKSMASIRPKKSPQGFGSKVSNRRKNTSKNIPRD